jgi:hypothetical protein
MSLLILLGGESGTTLTPDLFSNNNTFFSVTLVTTYELTPSLVNNTEQFFSVTLSIEQFLVASREDNINQFYSALVEQISFLIPDRFDNSSEFYQILLLPEGFPDPSNVKLGVVYGPTGTEYTGTLDIFGVKLNITTGDLVKPIGSKIVINI